MENSGGKTEQMKINGSGEKWYLSPASLVFICLVVFFITVGAAQNPISYTGDIEPIFREKCSVCHNHTVRQGGLNLESYSSLMNGGQSGVVIVPGQSAESRLVKMIEGIIKPRMPVGDQLSAGEIKIIKDWIDAGAPGPMKSMIKSAPQPEKIEADPLPNIPAIKPKTPVKAAVSALAFQPGSSIIAIGRYQEVELVDSKTGASAGKLSGHANQVRAVAFSYDGKLLAAAGGNPAQFGEIKIWSVSDRRELRSIRGHRDNVYAVAFSPDGSKLASCSYDKMIKLWDVETGHEIKNLKDHTDAVFSIAFSPDGKRLASASADRTVKIWDVTTGQRLYTMSDALDAINTLAFHPSGSLLAGAGSDRIIRIWEVGETEGKQIKSLIAHEDAINVIAFSPDGRLLVSSGADKHLKLWDAASLVESHTVEDQPDWIFALAFSPDGKRLAVGRFDGSVAFYDPATGKNVSGK
jgi:WD40 repeat protein